MWIPSTFRKVAEAGGPLSGRNQGQTRPTSLTWHWRSLYGGAARSPVYSTLDDRAARIRTEINGPTFAGIARRMTKAEAHGLERLLEVDPGPGSLYDALKQPAGAARASKFKEHLASSPGPTPLGPPRRGWRGSQPAKVAHFVGEARVTRRQRLRSPDGALLPNPGQACSPLPRFPFAMGTTSRTRATNPVRFLEMFRSDYFADFLAETWMALMPPEMVAGPPELDREMDRRSSQGQADHRCVAGRFAN